MASNKRVWLGGEAEGLRLLKRKGLGPVEADEAKVLESAWLDRAMGTAMIFRARGCSLKGLVDLLLKKLLEGVCPSPLLVDYAKEALIALWPSQPEALDTAMKQVTASFNPSLPFQFQAGAEICEVGS